MSGLYVKLDVEYMSNPKLLEAGPLAELIYVRALCFAKRTNKDGLLTQSQINLITFGIPQARKHIARLVEVEALLDAGGGRLVIEGWLDRNKPAAVIERESELKREASIQGNHERWHTGNEGKASPTCPLCHPDLDPKPHRKADRKQDRNARSTKEEEEVKEETEEQEEACSSTTDAAAAAIRMLIEHKVAMGEARNPAGFRRTMFPKLTVEHGDALNDYWRTHPEATAHELAERVLGLSQLDLYRIGA